MSVGMGFSVGRYGRITGIEERGKPMRYVVGLCLFALAAPLLASNPGEPLDCTDWVFLVPGLSCSVFTEVDDAATSHRDRLGHGVAVSGWHF